MEVKIIDLAGYEKNIEVKVPHQDLLTKIEELFKKYQKTMQLEGFRKGKVPLALIKKAFGTKIEREAAENAVPDILQEAIDNNKIKFHDLLKLEDFDFNRQDGLSFTAHIRVEPEIELTKYKKLEFEREIYQITEDDINQGLENLREQNATMVAIEGEAQAGHFVIADMQKTDKSGVPLIGQKFENRYFQLGGPGIDERVTAQLLGIKPGETRQITFKSKPDGSSQEVDEYFAISVKEIKEKNLPELNDEFAKDVGNYENLKALKDSLREHLERQFELNNKQKFDQAVMDQAVKSNPFDLPDFVVEDYLANLIANLKNSGQTNINEAEFREKYKADAVWNLKWMAIKEKIAELENIKVEEAAVNEYIEQLANNSKENAAKIRREYHDKKRRNQLFRELLETQVIAFLVEHGKVSEKKITFKDLQNKKEIIQH